MIVYLDMFDGASSPDTPSSISMHTTGQHLVHDKPTLCGACITNQHLVHHKNILVVQKITKMPKIFFFIFIDFQSLI